MVLLGLTVGAVVGVVFVARQPTGFMATSRVFGSIERADSVLVSQSTTLAAQRIDSYVELVGTTSLAEKVIARLDLNTSPKELASRMTAKVEKGTTILEVTVAASTEAQAKRISEAIPDELSAAVASVSSTGNDEAASNALFTIIDGPKISPARSQSRAGLAVLLGMAIGGAVGLAVAGAVARRAAGRSPEVVAASTGTPVVSLVPEAGDEKTTGNPLQSRRLAYHRLAANLSLVTPVPHRIVAVTGAARGSGASDVSRGLTSALAERGEKVLLIDATLGSTSRPEPTVGGGTLVDVVEDASRDVGSVVLTGVTGVSTLRISTSVERVQSPQTRRAVEDAIRELASGFDSTVMDTSPALVGADLPVPWRAADAVLVVITQGSGSLERANASLAVLAAMGIPRQGLVMNRVARGSVPDVEILSGLVTPEYESADRG
jgi:capsular polysaccharide biosynthesis protein